MPGLYPGISKGGSIQSYSTLTVTVKQNIEFNNAYLFSRVHGHTQHMYDEYIDLNKKLKHNHWRLK